MQKGFVMSKIRPIESGKDAFLVSYSSQRKPCFYRSFYIFGGCDGYMDSTVPLAINQLA